MSTAGKILPHYTYDDYCQWEGHWEVLEGIPYAMSPVPGPRHQFISGNIFREFSLSLKTSNCSCKSYMPLDYVVKDDTIVQPDFLVVCKEINKKFLDFTPSLVAEILSPATSLKDRNNKFNIYESQKIPYYLIVDIDTKDAEIYHLKENGKYTVEIFSPESPYTFQLDSDCSINVILNNIWE